MSKSRVTILLATYNGETYLEEQLDSIANQTHQNCTIVASDDGSSDNTLSILKHYKVVIHHSPRQGFAANFLSLIAKVEDDSAYYAFADQDDVWYPNKLARAIDWLTTIPKETPALYCGRTHLVDENLRSQGHSPLFTKTPSFPNALVQNIAGGNTMVFNSATLALLKQTLNTRIASHDWWAYLLVCGAGGQVHYDFTPYVHYRQHNANVVGSSVGFKAKLYRIRMLFKGRLRDWINLNNKGLLDASHLLTEENKYILQQFEQARQTSVIERLIKFYKLGLYRQTIAGQLGLVLGAVFNRI
ncbi:MAG: glycosyltransferase family 2 protein [Legionella sp.]|uniref:glycosyltransferase family 2 protein n=1 Tax=Legionella sp. TaxID=459 RepID=UPI0039E35A5B